MKSFFQDNLRLRFLFLITQTVLCNALLLLAVSHFLTYLMYPHIVQTELNPSSTYAVNSFVLIIFSISFIFMNKQFYVKYLFYKVTIAEKILARNGIFTAQFIRPPNIDVQSKVELGSLNYHESFKELNQCIDIAIRSGRILISENDTLETKFYIFGREATNVQIAKFKVENIKELSHAKNTENEELIEG